MYAIIENGGKQYKAVEGNYIEIDLLPMDIGKKKTFDKVLLLSTDDKVEVGAPFLKSVSVDTTVISHFKGEKVTIFKYRPKQRYRVKTGHRQKYSRVVVNSIAFPGKSASVKKSTETVEKEKSSTAKKPASAVKKTAAAKKTTAPKTPAKKASPAKSTKTTTTSAKKPTTSRAKTTTSKKSAPAKTATKKPTTKIKSSIAKTASKKSTTAKTSTSKKSSSSDKK